MPVTKSAKKALRTDQRRKLENDLVRSKIKNAIKGAKISISKRESDTAEKVQSVYRELDLAAKKNVIHRNKAARLKSRIAKAVSKAKDAPLEVKAKTKKASKAKSTVKKASKK